jgi:RNA polymerase sigma-70 factor (ECF subfamily)
VGAATRHPDTNLPSSDSSRRDSVAPDEAELVARCRGGDQEAWRELVERHARLVNGVLRGVFRLSSHDAEDVFQEVFTRVYVRLGTLREDHAVGSWIGQIARNAALDRLRSAPADLDADGAVNERVFDEPFAALEDALTVRAALARLPDHQGEILDRFFARDESYQTISAALDLPSGTIASRISRALAALRREIEEAAS